MKLISSHEVYRCDLFRVTEDHAKDPGGFEIRRSIVRHNGSAVMMAVDDRRRILLVRQYRLPANANLWELPAGRLDSGEKPLQAAKRELQEETGYRAPLEEADFFLSQPRLCLREDDHLFGHEIDRRRSATHGR